MTPTLPEAQHSSAVMPARPPGNASLQRRRSSTSRIHASEALASLFVTDFARLPASSDPALGVVLAAGHLNVPAAHAAKTKAGKPHLGAAESVSAREAC